MKESSFSLIIPCYNEEVNIQKGVLDRVGNYTATRDHIKEVLIVDDGSSDMSRTMIAKYLPKFPKLKLIENQHQGKAVAVMTGIKQAESDFVIFTDMDLATPLEEIARMTDMLSEERPIVIGSRAGRRKGAPWTRKLQSKGYVFVRNLLIGLRGIDDTQCGFKGFKRDAALKIIDRLLIFTQQRQAKGASVSAAFDLEFLFVARRLGYGISELPVSWQHAETKRVSLWSDTIETIKDLVRMRLNELQGKYKA